MIIFPSSRLLKNGKFQSAEYRSFVKRTVLRALSALVTHGRSQRMRENLWTQDERKRSERSEPELYRITIVEDDPVIQEELSNLLQSNGYEVTVITDFSRIAEAVKNDIPHLILLDINLPVQDGFKVCSKIRTFSNVPVIFVTSRNTDMDELNSIMLGGDGFITKPYNTSILLARIASLLKRAYPYEQAETMTYQVAGVSVDLDQNTELEKLKQDADVKRFDALLVTSLFHIHRDRRQALAWVREFQSLGIEVFSPLEGHISAGEGLI